MKKPYLKSLTISILLFLIFPFVVSSSNEKENSDWTIINQWAINDNASGLAGDGQYLYIGSYGGGNGPKVYRFDPQEGTAELLFSGPQSSAYGLTYDGQNLWTIDQGSSSLPAFALQIDMQGNEVSRFDLPDHYMSGIAHSEGQFYVATYYPDPGTIHLVDESGTEISDFVPPTDQPWDLAIQGDSLWIVDYWSGFIHLVLNDGTLVESFPHDHHRVSGIFYDGSFLWYTAVDGYGQSTLFKVDPWGTGTPVINAPFSHSFGNTTAGTTSGWNMTIENNGSGDLVIDQMFLSETNDAFSFNADLPITIPAGQSNTTEVTFAPQQVAVYDESITINSNDPAFPQVQVLLSGNGLHDGAFVFTDQQLINFGEVRMGSSSRDYLQLKNMGNVAMVIESIDFSDDAFYWDESVTFPVTLNPVQEKSMPFWFVPATAGVINAEMELLFNNSEQSPYSIEVKGLSDDNEMPVGALLWGQQLSGSFDFHAKAIFSIPDVTGDDVDDVIICTRDNMVRLFNGNSSGDADLIWEASLGGVEYPKAIALLDDIDDDGYNDIVIGTAWGDREITAVSSKTGSIIWQYQTNQYGQGGWVHMVDVKYDFNGDGYLDVLAATADDGDGTGPKRVFLFDGLNGDIIWEAPLNVSFYSVFAAEDFTGDGVPDVVAGAGSSADQGKVFGINGSTGNMVWEVTTSGTSVWALEQLDDITGDEIKDVIAGSFSGNYYMIDATNGDIRGMSSLGQAIILDFWHAGDLNDDGYVDIFPAYSSVNNAVAICGQTGQLLWTTQVDDQPWSVAPLSDITGDGINDLALGTLYENNNLYFINGSDGTIIKSLPMDAPVDAIAAIPDISQDLSMEVLAGLRNGYIGVFSGGPDASPQYLDITFHVTDDQDPSVNLEGAAIVISQTGSAEDTDENGMAVMQLVNGAYDFTVSLDGFYTYDGSFEIQDDDLLVEVILQKDDTGLSDPVNAKLLNAYNYPNPLVDHTDIVFTLSRPGKVTLIFYDITGKVIMKTPQQNFAAGENMFRWDGRDENGNLLNDGMYFFEIVTPDQNFKNRIMILRK